MSESKTTRNIDEIKKWAEKRGGRPSVVNGTEILRFDFNEQDQNLTPISWERFREIFENRDLAFLYQEETDEGGLSRFFKFISEK